MSGCSVLAVAHNAGRGFMHWLERAVHEAGDVCISLGLSFTFLAIMASSFCFVLCLGFSVVSDLSPFALRCSSLYSALGLTVTVLLLYNFLIVVAPSPYCL